MKLAIHSVASIEWRAKVPFPPRTALISIGDPDAPPPRLQHYPEHMLRLVFDDITPEGAIERLELPPGTVKRIGVLHQLLRNYNTILFDDEMAAKTVRFVMEHAAETDLLICQCEYGQSRSAAYAAAIAEVFGGYGKVIFRDERYCPNPWVYRKLIEAFQKYSAESAADASGKA